MVDVIRCKNLTKTFGSFIAVNKVSMRIPKGAVYGFLGPNGSGKSTTIRMLCGLMTPTPGTGHVLGYDITKDSEKIKHHIGYMSQKFSLYEELTVSENLDFYSGVYGLSKSQTKSRKQELMKMADLTGRENQKAGELSGGWKQRLALSCAMLHEPKILILDEPTAGVDPVSRRIFWNIIHHLSDNGVTVLVSTHYMDEAETCDFAGFIFNGQLLHHGTPTALKQQYDVNNLEEVFIRILKEVESGSDIYERG